MCCVYVEFQGTTSVIFLKFGDLFTMKRYIPTNFNVSSTLAQSANEDNMQYGISRYKRVITAVAVLNQQLIAIYNLKIQYISIYNLIIFLWVTKHYFCLYFYYFIYFIL